MEGKINSVWLGLGSGLARLGPGSSQLASALGLGSALPVAAWLHLARPGAAWLCSCWLGPAQLGFRPEEAGAGQERLEEAGRSRNVDFVT